MIVAGLFSLALALAQDPAAAPSDPVTVDEVVVEAASPEEVERFVDGLAAPTRSDRLSRWDRSICPAVIGLRGEPGRYVNERIADTAFAVGLTVEASPCRPDMVVLVTPDPDKAAAQLFDDFSRAMALKPRKGQVTRGGTRREAAAFMNSTRPVRWWHVSKTVPADGRPTQSGSVAPVSTGTVASRQASFTRASFTYVAVVVDGRRLRGLNYEQLASYLSMVALAQLEPEPSGEGMSSILTVFDDVEAGRSAPETLTSWDLAYLKGLYATRPDSRNSSTQKAAIGAEMQRAARKAD